MQKASFLLSSTVLIEKGFLLNDIFSSQSEALQIALHSTGLQ